MTTGIDIQFVRDFYQKMTDEDLIRVAIKEVANLTEEAQEVVNEEVKRRNLDTNASNASDDGQNNNMKQDKSDFWIGFDRAKGASLFLFILVVVIFGLYSLVYWLFH